MIDVIKAGALLLLFSACAAFAQIFPEDRDLFVNDYADLLADAQERDLRETLEAFYEARQIEFTVLTIDQMSDYGHQGSIESFATDLFNTWGIGDAQRNDGLLLLVSHLDRELRIEVGAGYGDSLNGPMQRIINKKIVPYFRLDDYPKGISAGVDEVIYQVAGRYPGEYDLSGLGHAINQVKRGFSSIISLFGAWLLILLIPLIPFGRRWYKRWQRNRARRCPVDGSRMHRYLEETEDEKLSTGQQLEERLKSIDHDVWYCDQCDHITIESYPTKPKIYGACGNCNYRTLEGRSLVTAMPSTSQTGQKTITWTCHNCKDVNVEHRVIPMTPPRSASFSSSSSRSSSSSSRSSSRGGGRSSGGGASGKW